MCRNVCYKEIPILLLLWDFRPFSIYNRVEKDNISDAYIQCFRLSMKLRPISHAIIYYADDIFARS